MLKWGRQNKAQRVWYTYYVSYNFLTPHHVRGIRLFLLTHFYTLRLSFWMDCNLSDGGLEARYK